MRLTTSYKEITAGIKRIFKHTSTACKPADFIPQSYYTRIRDGVNHPINPKHFKKSYQALTISDLPSVTRSFHLEYLQ